MYLINARAEAIESCIFRSMSNSGEESAALKRHSVNQGKEGGESEEVRSGKRPGDDNP